MTHRSLSDHIIELENRGLQFYRDCMRITNQFSTKYILESVLKRQRIHVNSIKSEIGALQKRPDVDSEISEKLDDFLKKKLPEEFDRENLNFVEATKLAIRMSDYYLEMYQSLSETAPDSQQKHLLKCVIDKKSAFTEQLKKEYERLRYK